MSNLVERSSAEEGNESKVTLTLHQTLKYVVVQIPCSTRTRLNSVEVAEESQHPHFKAA